MAEYLAPGVYVEEFDSGIKAMEGVGTSTAGFIGMAEKGPVRGMPVLVTSMADYQRRFGGYLPENTYQDMRFLPYAVEQFFYNGGSACYVMRVVKEAQEGASEEDKKKCAAAAAGYPAAAGKAAAAEKQFITMAAANPGAWGNRLDARFKLALKNKVPAVPDDSDNTVYTLAGAGDYREGDLVCLKPAKEDAAVRFTRIKSAEGNTVKVEWASDVTVPEEGSLFLYTAEWSVQIAESEAAEQYESVSFNKNRANYVENVLSASQMVTVKAEGAKLVSGVIEELLTGGEEPYFEMSFSGGSDGETEFNAALYLGKDGAPDSRTGLEAFRTVSDVSIMAIPGITDKTVQSALVTHCENMGNRFAILDMPLTDKEVAKLQAFRENIDSSYAAMYHPWLKCYDVLAAKNVFMPPSGAMAGIYGRTDNTRGVHKAPANETVKNCTGLSVNYNEAEQGKLNPKGVNLIRSLPGQGVRVWGARTCSSDGNWKYVNVRRLFIFIEESIRANTNWAVFEPNDEMLWSRVEGTIRVFLTTQWRNGALAGASADEAFFINIGSSTMTQDDILNGRLICVIGVAPVRPAEFVIFRITQKMETAQ